MFVWFCHCEFLLWFSRAVDFCCVFCFSSVNLLWSLTLWIFLFCFFLSLSLRILVVCVCVCVFLRMWSFVIFLCRFEFFLCGFCRCESWLLVMGFCRCEFLLWLFDVVNSCCDFFCPLEFLLWFWLCRWEFFTVILFRYEFYGTVILTISILGESFWNDVNLLWLGADTNFTYCGVGMMWPCDLQ